MARGVGFLLSRCRARIEFLAPSLGHGRHLGVNQRMKVPCLSLYFSVNSAALDLVHSFLWQGGHCFFSAPQNFKIPLPCPLCHHLHFFLPCSSCSSSTTHSYTAWSAHVYESAQQMTIASRIFIMPLCPGVFLFLMKQVQIPVPWENIVDRFFLKKYVTMMTT